jgi:hypothetical protein
METTGKLMVVTINSPATLTTSLASAQARLPSVLKFLMLGVLSLLLAGSGAVLTSHAFNNSAYFYYAQIPWIAVNFQVLVFTTGCSLLEKQLSVWNRTLQLLARSVLGAACCSAVIYAFRQALEEYRAVSLFVALGLEVAIALASMKPNVKTLAAMCIFVLPLFQLYFSILYGTVFPELPWSQNYTIWICFSYPVFIGLIKIGMQSKAYTSAE